MGLLSIIQTFRDAYFPELPENVGILAQGTCVIPLPIKKQKAPPKETVRDSYIEREETMTFGFRSNKASIQHEGSVQHLTSEDVQALSERNLWGQETNKGKAANQRTALAKALWHDGQTVKDVIAATGMSESWVEHRFAAFAAALMVEKKI